MKNGAAVGRNRPGQPAAIRVGTMFPAFGLSRMRRGVFYGETFGNRGGVEVPVSGNQRHLTETRILMSSVDFESPPRAARRRRPPSHRRSRMTVSERGSPSIAIGSSSGSSKSAAVSGSWVMRPLAIICW